jgi:hypothetical protein
MAGEPKPFRAAKRKQKTAVLQGAARLMFSRQAKQCPRDHGQTRENQGTEIAILTEISAETAVSSEVGKTPVGLSIN